MDLEISLQITATRENDNNNQVSARSNQYDSICLLFYLKSRNCAYCHFRNFAIMKKEVWFGHESNTNLRPQTHQKQSECFIRIDKIVDVFGFFFTFWLILGCAMCLFHFSSTYRVSHIEMYFLNWLWQIEICKSDFVRRWFWNAEFRYF